MLNDTEMAQPVPESAASTAMCSNRTLGTCQFQTSSRWSLCDSSHVLVRLPSSLMPMCTSTVRYRRIQQGNSINCLVKSTRVERVTVAQNERSEINGNSDVEGIKKADKGKF